MGKKITNNTELKAARKTRPATTKNKEVPSGPSAMKSLAAAEAQLQKTLNALTRATTDVSVKREKAKLAAEKAKTTRRVTAINAAKRARDVVRQAVSKRQAAAADVKVARESVRKAKQRVAHEEQQRRLLERKEVAKQKAVASFIKKWEREWDRKMKARLKVKSARRSDKD